MGKTPRSGFAAADQPLPASARASAPPPSVRRNSRLAGACEECFIDSLLATLTVDPLHDFVERIAMDRIAQPGFRRREHVTILIDAEFVLVRPRSGRSPRLTPADCAAARGGSASSEATAAVTPAEVPKNSRRVRFRSDIIRSASLLLPNCSEFTSDRQSPASGLGIAAFRRVVVTHATVVFGITQK